MKKIILSFVILFFVVSGYSQAPAKPYNPGADGKSDLKKAIQQAESQRKHVLIQIGGNWCPWCLKFHTFATTEPNVDSLIRADYVYLMLNYSKENKNWEIMKQLEYPNRFGFPVFVVLDGKGKLLHTQDSGLLEEGKGYDTTKVVTFLKMWNVRALNPATYPVN
jgi:thioredoxin-related protein